jgi:murein DD-endopeptidase MepM/ murein hydrolase activator NlpD
MAVPGPVSAGPEETRKELNRVRERIEDIRDELDRIKAKADSLRLKRDSITTQMSQVTVQVEALAAAIDEAEIARDRARRQEKRLQGRLEERARTIYIQGPTGAIDLVLGAHSLPDLSDRITFLELLNRNDADLAAGVAEERRILTDSKADLKRWTRQKQRLLERLEGKEAELRAAIEDLEASTEAYADRYAEARKLAKRLGDKLAEQLAARYAALQNTGGSFAPPPGANGPFYWCPVDPPRSYIDDFGFPRVGHTHQGNDIFAPEGTPIRAPFAGTAEEGYDGLGGIVVHVYASANADYVYNAHLSRHAGVDGSHVEPGDLIGYVGDTGNAQGTSPHDHFEYHPGGGSAVSPYVYLNEVCGVGGG